MIPTPYVTQPVLYCTDVGPLTFEGEVFAATVGRVHDDGVVDLSYFTLCDLAPVRVALSIPFDSSTSGPKPGHWGLPEARGGANVTHDFARSLGR